MNDRPVIAEQRAFYESLSTVWTSQVSEDKQSDEIRTLLLQLAENVLHSGVVDWSGPKPLVNWSIAQWYVKGRFVAVRLYGVIGAEAVAYTQKDLADSFKIGIWENKVEE
jgi:hypothetical protein